MMTTGMISVFRAMGLTLGVGLVLGWKSEARALDFNREVRPILSSNCFKCHGPDAKTRKADLRLDIRAEAESVLKPDGDQGLSELMKRVLSEDPDEVMPPPSTKKVLSGEEKRILAQWVSEGAGYEDHWAFVKPEAGPLPEVKRTSWVRNEIDSFILARLEAQGLEPNDEADRVTLLRRVYLDLIGIPPSPEEVDAFVAESDDRAYERWVDRLLASPRYGERWGRRWLDLARYADTNGYEKDRPRSIWPYRDWVIQALNRDMPLDEFTEAQIAGDMIPGGGVEERVATGFHRNTMINEEGGIDPLEFRFYSMVDRVATTGTVWMGLTLGCAQCHTHKYDPIQHQEYYQVMALMNNADEIPMSVPDPNLAGDRDRILREIQALQSRLPERFPLPGEGDASSLSVESRKEAFEQALDSWRLERARDAVSWEKVTVKETQTNLPRLEVLEDGSLLASGDQTKRDVYELVFEGDWSGVTALRLEVIPDERLPNGGPGRAYYEGPLGDFFLSELELALEGGRLEVKEASESYGKLGIGGGAAGAAQALDGNEVTGWSTNGRQGQENQAVFVLAKPLEGHGKLEVRMIFNRHYPAGLGRFRWWVTRQELTPKAKEMPTAVEAVLAQDWTQASEADRAILRNYFAGICSELEPARKEIEALRNQVPRFPSTLVFQELPDDSPRKTHLHHRGEFLQAKEEVSPGLPAFLKRYTRHEPGNRLEFAQWLVSEENPLVGRVMVNRQWSAFFGTGLVKTEEDFGYQGESPSHPELLDWLAVEFARKGWSFKNLHRWIVTSATYRQGAEVTAGKLEKDPDNRLLSRFPRKRMEAEVLRDSLLSAAGLLSAKMGGPSVFPMQPSNITTEGAYGRLDWKVSTGEDAYRRSLYTFTKRTTPFAMFTTFDAGSGESCLPRREVTNTPLQALTLLNDEAFLVAARALAKRVLQGEGTEEEKEVTLFRRVLSRYPTKEERVGMKEFLEEMIQQEDGWLPGRIVGDPTEGVEEGTLRQQAAWVLLARALMNLDEAVVRP